ncbi:hypothetical protein C8J57DRAFT_1248250 [Mycena rebaudengoi]|nr:hypothetical protein C8J57DRAFT_1248250 [Mycena rebaudengoi]
MMFKLSTLALAASLLGMAVASPTNSELESRATCQGNNSTCGGPFPACCSGLFCNTLNGRCGPCMARNGACQLGVPCCAGLTCSALSGVSDYMHLLRGFPTDDDFTAMQLSAQSLMSFVCRRLHRDDTQANKPNSWIMDFFVYRLQLYYCVTLICGATLLDASVRWDTREKRPLPNESSDENWGLLNYDFAIRRAPSTSLVSL